MNLKKFLILIFASIITMSFAIFAEDKNLTFDEIVANAKNIRTIKDYDKETSVDKMQTIVYGSIEQDKSEKEPIEWIVLYKNDKEALLMSKYILDAKPFNIKTERERKDRPKEIYYHDDYKYTCYWQESSLREWLNSDFYNKIFTDDEKKHVKETNVNDRFLYDIGKMQYKGEYTKDNLFILSEDEVFYFFGKNTKDKSAKNKSTRGTKYAIKNGLKINVTDEDDKKGNVWYSEYSPYMMRMSAKPDDHVRIIGSDGVYTKKKIDETGYGVRPCFFLNLSDNEDSVYMDLDKIKGNDKGEEKSIEEINAEYEKEQESIEAVYNEEMANRKILDANANIKDSLKKINDLKEVQEYNKDITIDACDGIKIGKVTVNKKEYELEWAILKKEKDKALLLCKNAIQKEKFIDSENAVNKWNVSSVRQKLNSDFITATFTEEQRKQILQTILENKANIIDSNEKDMDTSDKIFLLSYDEILKYFNISNNELNINFNSSRHKSVAQLNILRCRSVDNKKANWMLRTIGHGKNSVSLIGQKGEINLDGMFSYKENYVRPAMWISLVNK